MFACSNYIFRAEYWQTVVHWLCTRAEHQRRGAATMLLNAAIDRADQEELELWALASPMILSSGGASNLGFEPVEAWNYDPQLGGKERPKESKWPLRKVLMKREPHKWM